MIKGPDYAGVPIVMEYCFGLGSMMAALDVCYDQQNHKWVGGDVKLTEFAWRFWFFV